MIDGFQKAVDELIENRLGELINSDEYIMYSETIHKDLEEKLALFNETSDQEIRDEVIEGLRSNIFEQVYFQSKMAYRMAFNDALVFMINTLILPKKPNNGGSL